MLRTRVIPVLLLYNGGLYKTIQFKNPRYIGDPINAVRIFNEKEVDELVLYDISASEQKKSPDFDLIEEIATECFMPICYGGGIKTEQDAERLFRLGVEKISINTSFVEDEDILRNLSKKFGRSSVVVTIDVKKDLLGKYKVYTNRGKDNTGVNLSDSVRKVEELGAGEMIINNIDRDGTMKGYDIKLLKEITKISTIPVVACGGAGKMEDLKEVVVEGGVSGVAAGSLFVYWGSKKGVLINYPDRKEIDF